MAVVTLDQLKDHLALTEDVGGLDDALLEAKIAAAEGHIERLLGFAMLDEYEDVESVPAPLKEAIMQLSAWWYEQREAGIVGQRVAEAPYSVREIVAEFRGYTF